MTKTKILIVEDEAIIAENIKETIVNLGYDVVGIADNALDAVDLDKVYNPDIILLDINIQGDRNGIWLAENIFSNKPFIYLTAYGDENTIKQAVNTNPSGYLLKPFRVEDISATIQIALQNFVRNKKATIADNPKEDKENAVISNNNYIFVKQKSAYIKLIFNDILFFESDKNYLKIQTEEDLFTIRGTLKSIKDKLPSSFFQVHRSFIANLNHIKKINPISIKIESYVVPLSNSFRKELISRFKLLE